MRYYILTDKPDLRQHDLSSLGLTMVEGDYAAFRWRGSFRLVEAAKSKPTDRAKAEAKARFDEQYGVGTADRMRDVGEPLLLYRARMRGRFRAAIAAAEPGDAVLHDRYDCSDRALRAWGAELKTASARDVVVGWHEGRPVVGERAELQLTWADGGGVLRTRPVRVVKDAYGGASHITFEEQTDV